MCRWRDYDKAAAGAACANGRKGVRERKFHTAFFPFSQSRAQACDAQAARAHTHLHTHSSRHTCCGAPRVRGARRRDHPPRDNAARLPLVHTTDARTAMEELRKLQHLSLVSKITSGAWW